MKKYGIGIVLVALAVVAALSFGNHKPDNQQTVGVTTRGSYIALGDSVAAGVGLADYTDSSACNRTKQAYPEKIANQMRYKLDSFACSGATTSEGVIGPQVVNKLALEPQLTKVVANKKPALITITIGANDANWTTAIQKCYTDLCGTNTDTGIAEAGISNASINLDKALTQIKSVYPTNTPNVVITGYYKLFPTIVPEKCTELSGVETSELAWIKQLQDDIDTTLQAVAAKYNFAVFAPISFEGHELCTGNPWIQSLGGKAPYHPTDAGQSAIAKQVVAALSEREESQ